LVVFGVLVSLLETIALDLNFEAQDLSFAFSV
jgi:hypothetical protein